MSPRFEAQVRGAGKIPAGRKLPNAYNSGAWVLQDPSVHGYGTTGMLEKLKNFVKCQVFEGWDMSAHLT